MSAHGTRAKKKNTKKKRCRATAGRGRDLGRDLRKAFNLAAPGSRGWVRCRGGPRTLGAAPGQRTPPARSTGTREPYCWSVPAVREPYRLAA
eukprot:1587516-Rhodomonas_salina.2